MIYRHNSVVGSATRILTLRPAESAGFSFARIATWRATPADSEKPLAYSPARRSQHLRVGGVEHRVGRSSAPGDTEVFNVVQGEVAVNRTRRGDGKEVGAGDIL